MLQNGMHKSDFLNIDIRKFEMLHNGMHKSDLGRHRT